MALSRTGTVIVKRCPRWDTMQHPSLRHLFDYWNARRGRRIAPARSDIEPTAIRHVLADIFILSGEPRRGYQFRIAGTRVCALFGRELKGEAFLDLWSPMGRDEVGAMVATVADEATGVVARATGSNAAGAALDLELLLLPLSFGHRDERLIGAVAPTERPPSSIGTQPLSNLRIDTSGSAVVDGIGRIGAPRSLGRLRHGFVVYDGGNVWMSFTRHHHRFCPDGSGPPDENKGEKIIQTALGLRYPDHSISGLLARRRVHDSLETRGPHSSD
jgi:hypothetical protein